MAISSTTQIPTGLVSALQNASAVTGADFQYLVNTAARESGFRADAKASSSSATGLFQFIESTWLEMVKEKGPEMGLSSLSKHISKLPNGGYRVADGDKRREILELRNDPEIASLMAGAFTQSNAKTLESEIGRKPTSGELYIAHFLGARSGSKLIKASSLQPSLKAADLFPQAARSNKSLFYKRGKAVSAKGLYQNLVRRHHTKEISIAGLNKVTGAPLKTSTIAAVSKVSPVKAPDLPVTSLQADADNIAVKRVGAVVADGALAQNINRPHRFIAVGNTEKAGPVTGSLLGGKSNDGGQIGVWGGFAKGNVEPDRGVAHGERPQVLAEAGAIARIDSGNHQDRLDEKPSRGPILETGAGARGLFRRGGLGFFKG